jgi:hypothetical protein
MAPWPWPPGPGLAEDLESSAGQIVVLWTGSG